MKTFLLILIGALAYLPVSAQSALDCSLCHSAVAAKWAAGPHSATQLDVADELAGERAGETPDEVINGADPEDCIACHGALAVTVNGGMTEPQALAYFFSTENGVFTANTQALNTEQWPHNACVTCHNVPNDHPTTMPSFAIYDSRNAAYTAIENTSTLCGQCHGSLRFAGTDHLRTDAWLESKHGHGGQNDVAEELSGEAAGMTPEDLIADENCIACHAATSVLVNGGMTEAQALSYFFTTENGLITENTSPQNTDMWTEVACITCHNPHKPDDIAYFNSETKEYETLSTTDELCGKCHGNIRFPDTDHLSYNIAQGTGAVGVSDQITMTGITCVDCHMFAGEEDTKTAMYAGHSWKVFVTEDDGSVTTGCNTSNCHPTMDVNTALATVESFKAEFASLDSIANEKILEAADFLVGSTDPIKLQMLEDAQTNLAFAEGDESGGVHNHNYTTAILNDVIDKSTYILTGVEDNPAVVKEFALYQNYPNPFNPTTVIKFALPRASNVRLTIYNSLGKVIAVLVNRDYSAGYHQVVWNAENMSSGVYFCRLKAGNFTQVNKMLLIK